MLGKPDISVLLVQRRNQGLTVCRVAINRMLRGKMTPSYSQAPAKLPQLVQSRFNNAKANGDVNFYPTQVAVLKPGSVPVCSTSRRS